MIGERTLKELIRDVPDFPADGILFRDITPVLKDSDAFREVIREMSQRAQMLRPDVIVGVESRGFVLGAPIAMELGLGFVPVRKFGKLPAETIKAEYALEYGTNIVEIHKDAIDQGQRVVVIDDLLATGGTAAASIQLIEELGGEVAGLVFLIELGFLDGRKRLDGYHTEVLVRY
jgi:adenine phosphoribosyltransferase